MELAELTAYAYEKYQIAEQHKWQDFPGFSVLCHPETGKWIALLMRQWDTDLGGEIQRCDLKCGGEALLRSDRPYLTAPLRMRGKDWINIAFDRRTEPDIVFRLFDRAVAAEKPHGFTIVLASQLPANEGGYRDTPLPFTGASRKSEKEHPPEKLRQLRHMFDYGRGSDEARARRFYEQALFMRDYEDTVPWSGEFFCYYPTYEDMTTRQLRGYFTWRAKARQGDYEPISASAAYLYIYELLNCVGASSPEDALDKLKEFESGYLPCAADDRRMRQNLRRWMLEFAVLHGLPQETALNAMDPDTAARDEALATLRTPDAYGDDAVFAALCFFGGKKTETSPVPAGDPEKGKRLFAAVWRAAAADYRREGNSLFTLCFGRKKTRRWYPLANAVYCEKSRPADRGYILNECRSYVCKNGQWQSRAYETLSFNKALLQGFLHETDARLRRRLKTGRYLKEKPEFAWVIPYADAAIAEMQRAEAEAARPKITIDLSSLAKIRSDAETTRDSLLTEEETEAAAPEPIQYEEEITTTPEDNAFSASAAPDLPLDGVQIQILRALLAGENPGGILRENRLTPSIAADGINEALFDEIGDTALLCENDALALVDDYIPDLQALLGGTDHG